MRGGRPVLRMPSSTFFESGDAQLKPDGKDVLTQVAQAASSGSSRFELRVETYTDSEGETPDASAAPPRSPAPAKSKPAMDAWTLTADRAASIAHFLRDGAIMPFQNIVAVGRADFQPIEAGSTSGSGHARNRRVEITITPVPGSFRGPETPKSPHGKPTPSTKSPSSGKTSSTVTPAPAADTSANTGSP